jgi:hypothetical protein
VIPAGRSHRHSTQLGQETKIGRGYTTPVASARVPRRALCSAEYGCFCLPVVHCCIVRTVYTKLAIRTNRFARSKARAPAPGQRDTRRTPAGGTYRQSMVQSVHPSFGIMHTTSKTPNPKRWKEGRTIPIFTASPSYIGFRVASHGTVL